MLRGFPKPSISKRDTSAPAMGLLDAKPVTVLPPLVVVGTTTGPLPPTSACWPDSPPPPQAVKRTTSDSAADDLILFKFVGILIFIYFYLTSISIGRFTVKYQRSSQQMRH